MAQFNYDASMVFMECILLREHWNYLCCKEYEPFGLTLENRYNMDEFQKCIVLKKFGKL